MYIALHYTRIKGKVYSKGEIIRADLDEKTANWLKGKGAIKETAPDPDRLMQPEEPGQVEEETPSSEATTTERTEDAPEDQADEDEEIPEIDVMDGLVADEPEAEKPAPKPKKQAERRKAK